MFATTSRIPAQYRECRKNPTTMLVGRNAEMALRHAVTLIKWRALEDRGLVRMRAEYDQDWRPDCDCDDPKCLSKQPDAEAFGSIGEYCLPGSYGSPDEEWEHADSVWGHVGYNDVLDPFENCYIIDIMSETIEAFKVAWKDRVRKQCPACHGTGRVQS